MVFLSAGAQYYLQAGQRILFGISSLFNLVSLYCLIKETPPNQAKIRIFLLMTQAAVIINSIYMDVLFEPIPLFPALAGICTGILCKVGVPPHTSLPKSAALIMFCLLGCIVPATAYAVMPFDLSQAEHMMVTSPFNISWAIMRGPYFIHERSPIVLFFMSITVALVAASFVACFGIFFRMFYVLNQNKTQSPQTILKIRKSLNVLFIQLCTPFFMLEVPAIGMFGALIIMGDMIPFEVYLCGFYMMPFHPLLHNLVLLGITPTYRQIIKSFVFSATEKTERVGEAPGSTSAPRMDLQRSGPSLAWAAPESAE